MPCIALQRGNFESVGPESFYGLRDRNSASQCCIIWNAIQQGRPSDVFRIG